MITSIKSDKEFYTNPIGLPESITIENYTQIIIKNNLHVYFINSVIVTLFAVIICLIVSSMISFVIMRLSNWLGTILYGLFILGLMLPNQVNMIPLYSVLERLGLLNSLLGLILVTATSTMSVSVFIIGGFMLTISRELVEASALDGATDWQIYTRVVIPLSVPSMAVAGIFVTVISWNDLLYPLLFIHSPHLKTLPLALLGFQGEYLSNYPMIFTGVIIASIPMVVAYVFLQRYFVEGITAGANKG